ncbi:bet1-like SNARE 1-2 isoform X2 [Brassica rapa]|uniref:bet1-like SNARE 1-2 isoform X2 n=1 Tax=Brassica campestris TaxID=3711 RepID=UPI00142D2DEB|nr:bet1-like SNARE 1-2 isoform X2 [Brassica rapa]
MIPPNATMTKPLKVFRTEFRFSRDNCNNACLRCPKLGIISYQVTGDIHEEVESHNRMLDKVGNKMDSARGIMSGTINRFKLVFEKKSNRKTCKLIGYFVLLFLVMYYLIRLLNYIKG